MKIYLILTLNLIAILLAFFTQKLLLPIPLYLIACTWLFIQCYKIVPIGNTKWKSFIMAYMLTSLVGATMISSHLNFHSLPILLISVLLFALPLFILIQNWKRSMTLKTTKTLHISLVVLLLLQMSFMIHEWY